MATGEAARNNVHCEYVVYANKTHRVLLQLEGTSRCFPPWPLQNSIMGGFMNWRVLESSHLKIPDSGRQRSVVAFF